MVLLGFSFVSSYEFTGQLQESNCFEQLGDSPKMFIYLWGLFKGYWYDLMVLKARWKIWVATKWKYLKGPSWLSKDSHVSISTQTKILYCFVFVSWGTKIYFWQLGRGSHPQISKRRTMASMSSSQRSSRLLLSAELGKGHTNLLMGRRNAIIAQRVFFPFDYSINADIWLRGPIKHEYSI